MKKKILSVAVIVICLAILSYGSLAYFTAKDTAHNVITTGDIGIELLEWADQDRTQPFPKDGVSGVMPGATVTKIAEVTNTGSNQAWIRVKVTKSIHLAPGVEGEVDLGLMTLDFDTEKWTQRDGFYYYNQPLAPGRTTEPLFAGVAFDVNMDNRYRNCTAQVLVEVQAVQTANNGASALEAAGWPQDTQ